MLYGQHTERNPYVVAAFDFGGGVLPQLPIYSDNRNKSQAKNGIIHKENDKYRKNIDKAKIIIYNNSTTSTQRRASI